MSDAKGCIPSSCLNRCLTCNKPFSTAALCETTIAGLSGGVCVECGKPAIVDYARSVIIKPPEKEQSPLSLLREENAVLRDTLLRMKRSKEIWLKLMEDQRRARKRSLDAHSRTIAISKEDMSPRLAAVEAQLPAHATPLERKLAIARADLSLTEESIKSFNTAKTLLDVQQMASHLEQEVVNVHKQLRAAKTDNIVREKQILKLLKNPSDFQLLQERLRKELTVVRSRNISLASSVDANSVKFAELQKVITRMKEHDFKENFGAETSKSVLTLELSLLESKKAELENTLRSVGKLDLESSSKNTSVANLEIQSSSVVSPLHVNCERQESVSLPISPSRSISPTGLEVLTSRPLSKSEVVLEVAELKECVFCEHTSDISESTYLIERRGEEDLLHDDNMHISSISSIEGFAVPELAVMDAVTPSSHELESSGIAPRQLFQSVAASQLNEEIELGPRTVENSVLASPSPEVKVPGVFKVDSRP